MGSPAGSRGSGVTGRKLGVFLSYAAAVVAVSVSLGICRGLSTALGTDLPTLLFLSPAVLLAAFLAGMGPGLAATAAAVLEAALWTYPPGPLSAGPVAAFLLFSAVGILASIFAGSFRRARRRTARETRESVKAAESSFLAMFHSSPISMSLVRVSDGTCSDVNQAHVDLFGLSREESIGRKGAELNLWVDLRDRERFLGFLAENQRVSSYEANLRRKRGDIVTTLLSAEQVRLDGEPFLWLMHHDITERKRTEEKFRLVVESAPAGLVMVDRRGRIQLVNAQAEKQFGYARSELVGGSIETLIPVRLRSAHQRQREDYFLDAQPRSMGNGRELSGLRRDGTEFPVEIALTPIETADGTQVMASVVDITERRKIEGALRESDLALRTLVDAIPGMVLLMDTDGIVLAANETMAQNLGTTAPQLVGRLAYGPLPPGVARSRKAYADECIRTGQPRHYEDRRADRDFDNYMYPIKDGNGNVTRLAVLSLDITERKRSEAKIKEQAALLDQAADAILAKDLEGRILYWNKGAESMYGWTAEEAAGRQSLALLQSEEYLPEGVEAQRQVLEKGDWRGELHQRTMAGRKITSEGRWTLIRNENGEPSGILSVNTDVTARRSIEAQLLRSQRLESLGTLAGGIAHDLNNVLAPILMGLEGLALHDPDESVRSILSIIRSSAQRGANIVRQILNFARGMEGEIGEIQLRHVLREVVDIARETFPRSIALAIDFPKDLWPVNGDATQMHQVLMNLCVNARDSMPDGGRILVAAENVHLDETYARMNIEARPIRYVAVKVEDTGTGMTPDVLERIFDPFFTTKAPGKGTGLGLATVRTIVKGHGGFVNVYSEPNKGTSFKVYIPAAEKAAAPGEGGSEEGIPMGQGELILLVDDEASLRDIARQILESYGYRVTTAADGTEAVVRFAEREKDIRLVVTDMMMPHMDGAATIRAIRNLRPTMPFIATSGLAASEHEREARGLGVNAFLAKPYTAEKLLHALRDVLDREPKPPARG